MEREAPLIRSRNVSVSQDAPTIILSPPLQDEPGNTENKLPIIRPFLSTAHSQPPMDSEGPAQIPSLKQPDGGSTIDIPRTKAALSSPVRIVPSPIGHGNASSRKYYTRPATLATILSTNGAEEDFVPPSIQSTSWTSAFCGDPGEDLRTCCVGFSSPCLTYGHTQYQLLEMGARHDPVDRGEHHSCNLPCWMFFGMCLCFNSSGQSDVITQSQE